MTVRTRLILTVVGISALLVIPSIYSLAQLRDVQEITEEIQGKHAAAILDLGRLQTALAEVDRFLGNYVAVRDPEHRRRAEERLERARGHVAGLERAGFPAQASEIAPHLDSVADATQRLGSLIASDQRQAATDVFQDEVRPLLQSSQGFLTEVAEAIDQRSAADVERARMLSASAITTVLLGLLATLTAALLLGLWTTRALTAPLRRLREAMVPVTKGRFEVPENLPYGRHDEIGDLSRSFRYMARQLAELDRLRAEFLSMASHDLKTPINVIGGYAELLETGVYGEVNARQREVLQTISEQGRQLTEQVNQLLNVSRMEAGGFRIHLRPMVVEDLLASLERTFGALAEQKSIAFSVSTDESVPGQVVGDVDRLRNEVLGNLLSNAFKFTPEGGSISVQALRDGDRLAIRVEDTGKGIPAEQLDQVFEKFFQVGEADRSMGTGLGLAIARQVVEAHDGTIDVESDVGGGTAFTIRIPLEQEAVNRRVEGLEIVTADGEGAGEEEDADIATPTAPS